MDDGKRFGEIIVGAQVEAPDAIFDRHAHETAQAHYYRVNLDDYTLYWPRTAEQVRSLEVEPCALSIVDDYEVPLIMAINDCCHLEGVRSGLSAQVR